MKEDFLSRMLKEDIMNFDKNRHAVFKLQYHLITVTKYRYKVIDEAINLRLKTIAHDIFENRWKCKIIEIESEPDHIHIAFESQPQVNLSRLIGNFKTVSSRLIRKEFKDTLMKYYQKPLFWSPSYCILSVGGVTIDVIKRYIGDQNKPE